jgi:integrase
MVLPTHTARSLSLLTPWSVVSEMLGHADTVIKLRIYAHVLPDMQDTAANMMDMMLGSN